MLICWCLTSNAYLVNHLSAAMLITSISLYSQSTDWWECMYCKSWIRDAWMAPGAWLQFSVSCQHFWTQLLYNDGLRGKTLFWPWGDLFAAKKRALTRTHQQLSWVAALCPTLFIQPWYLAEHQSIGPIKSLICWWCWMKIVRSVMPPLNSTESHPTVLEILQSRPRRGASGKILRGEAATVIQFAYMYSFDTDIFIWY